MVLSLLSTFGQTNVSASDRCCFPTLHELQIKTYSKCEFSHAQPGSPATNAAQSTEPQRPGQTEIKGHFLWYGYREQYVFTFGLNLQQRRERGDGDGGGGPRGWRGCRVIRQWSAGALEFKDVVLLRENRWDPLFCWTAHQRASNIMVKHTHNANIGIYTIWKDHVFHNRCFTYISSVATFNHKVQTGTMRSAEPGN